MMDVVLAEAIGRVLEIPLNSLPGGSIFPEVIKVRHVLMFVPTVRPSWHYLIAHQHLQQLQPGDIIVIRSATGWLTYAVVSGTLPRNETVICFTDLSGRPVTDMEAFFKSHVRLREVHISRLWSIMQAVSFTVVRQYDKPMTLRRAYGLMEREREWHFFLFNSEHFASCAFRGEPQSQQIHTISKHFQKDATIAGVGVVAFLVKVVKEGFEEVLKESSDEALTGLEKLTNGGKAYFLPGIIIEGAFCFYKLAFAYKQMKEGEISKAQFQQKVARSIGASTCSFSFGLVGATIGTAIIPVPVVGSVVGGVAGGAIGNAIGGMAGDMVMQEFSNTRPY